MQWTPFRPNPFRTNGGVLVRLRRFYRWPPCMYEKIRTLHPAQWLTDNVAISVKKFTNTSVTRLPLRATLFGFLFKTLFHSPKIRARTHAHTSADRVLSTRTPRHPDAYTFGCFFCSGVKNESKTNRPDTQGDGEREKKTVLYWCYTRRGRVFASVSGQTAAYMPSPVCVRSVGISDDAFDNDPGLFSTFRSETWRRIVFNQRESFFLFRFRASFGVSSALNRNRRTRKKQKERGTLFRRTTVVGTKRRRHFDLSESTRRTAYVPAGRLNVRYA